jgi:hypothetical protein
MEVSINEGHLEEWTKSHPPQGFKPKPVLNRRGNMIVWYFSDEEGYAEPIFVDGVDVGHLIRSFKTKEIVGVKVFLDGMPITITDSPATKGE